MAILRKYSEMKLMTTIEERYEYLKLRGGVGVDTFGFDRYINQQFYASPQWKRVRYLVILRDNGCDLGIPGYEIHDKILVHHMNPVTVDDFRKGSLDILDPNFLICVSHRTHQAIHYGDASLLPQDPIVRKPGDTKLW